ncbi:MAG: hypothetical protein U1E53_00270 [Dongiaceae bacterium]
MPNLAIIALMALLWKANANWAASCRRRRARGAAWEEPGRAGCCRVLAFNLPPTPRCTSSIRVDRLGLPLTPVTDPFNDAGSDVSAAPSARPPATPMRCW